MEQNEMQLQFFQHIKGSLPPHLSFVDEIADILEISNDSAYRRIRGEKMLSFEEIKKLCSKFRISVDQLLSLDTDTTIFSGKYGSPEKFKFEELLESFLQSVQFLHSFSRREVFYFTKDIPAFYYFMFPELASFKYFAWMKTLLNYPEYNGTKFKIGDLMDALQDKGTKMAELYIQIPSTEIMNVECLMTTLRQLEYYKETGLIANSADLEILYMRIDEMVDHMERQAEAGLKFLPGKKPAAKSAELKMYVNDFVVGDNSILAILDDSKFSFLNHNVVHYMATKDRKFTDYSFAFTQNVIKKSTLVSVVGERERTRFFNLVRERIEIFRSGQFKMLSKI